MSTAIDKPIYARDNTNHMNIRRELRVPLGSLVLVISVVNGAIFIFVEPLVSNFGSNANHTVSHDTKRPIRPSIVYDLIVQQGKYRVNHNLQGLVTLVIKLD